MIRVGNKSDHDMMDLNFFIRFDFEEHMKLLVVKAVILIS
jgi:hypothetical protein